MIVRPKAHKYVFGASSASKYEVIVFCEYCGQIAFASIASTQPSQKESAQPCPLAQPFDVKDLRVMAQVVSTSDFDLEKFLSKEGS